MRTRTHQIQAYFNRNIPWYLISKEEMATLSELAFDAYPVLVRADTLKNAQDLRALTLEMDAAFFNATAPEDSAQELAELFEERLRRIMKTRKQDNERK